LIKIRPAALGDIPAIISIAMESVATDPLPVKPCEKAMRETALALIGNRSQFVWVATVDECIVACVAVSCSRSFWFSGWQASMILFWSRHPGAAIPLLRRLSSWIKERPIIKTAVVECEPKIDPRAIKFLKRLGFSRESTNLVYVK
jgi:hypothetical protein